jgi:hypothetical protein
MRFTNEWLGTTNTNWSTPGNWVNNVPPDFGSCLWVVIPNVDSLPKLTGATAIPNIAIAKGATLDLNGKTLTVNGAFLGTGKLKSFAYVRCDYSTPGDAGTVYFGHYPALITS